MVVKIHLHSSSGVQENRVGHNIVQNNYNTCEDKLLHNNHTQSFQFT
jgi:hypothetical protein